MLRDFINSQTSRRTEGEIAEELRFHCEMLAQEFQARGMSEDAARIEASRRFGDVGSIQKQCVAITRRNGIAVKLLKLVLAILFAGGVLFRVTGDGIRLHHLGDVMVITALLGHVFLRVRRIKPPSAATPGSLVLPRLEAMTSIEPYDRLGRTPVERFLTDETRAGS